MVLDADVFELRHRRASDAVEGFAGGVRDQVKVDAVLHASEDNGDKSGLAGVAGTGLGINVDESAEPRYAGQLVLPSRHRTGELKTPGRFRALRGDLAVDKGGTRLGITGYPWFHSAYLLLFKLLRFS